MISGVELVGTWDDADYAESVARGADSTDVISARRAGREFQRRVRMIRREIVDAVDFGTRDMRVHSQPCIHEPGRTR